MAKPNLKELFSKYPEIIEEMKDVFTSHEFILKLASKYQVLYIDALHKYAFKEGDTISNAPFKDLHGKLATELLNYPKYIQKKPIKITSKNIFRNSGKSAEWRKNQYE